MKIAVVGLGYWGPNLVRNFLSTEGIDRVVCCDVVENRLERIKKRYPVVEVTTSFAELLKRSDIDAVVLATPVSTHHPLGMQALEAGKHLLVEKPLSLKTVHAEEMVEFAERQGLCLMVDHTYVYTGAVQKMKEYVMTGKIGDVLYFDSVRINLGLFQHDTNVIWDLAVHDISIMNSLIEEKPLSVMAVGAHHYNGKEDIAYITIFFPNHVIAHFHVNWISPVKVRRILIGGTKQMLVYDDMESSDKVKLYDKGVHVEDKDSAHDALIQYRTGDMLAPMVGQSEALSLMAKEFVDSITLGRQPLTDGWAGLNVVKILEAAETSLRSGGELVKFASGCFEKDQVRQAHAFNSRLVSYQTTA